MAWSGGVFTRTNGSYSGATVWNQDYQAGQTVNPVRADVHDQDLATGINSCLNKDGTNAATANLNIGGYRLTNLGVATAIGDAVRLNESREQSFAYATTGGSSGAYTLTLAPAVTSYVAGLQLSFLTNHTAAVAGATLNVNGLGAKILVGSNASGVVTGSFLTNAVYQVIYDGTYFRIISPMQREAITFAPAPAMSSGGTYTAVTVNSAIYTLDPLNATCTVHLSFTGTAGGTLTGRYLDVTLPHLGLASASYPYVRISEGSTYYMAQASVVAGTLSIYKLSWAGAITDYTAGSVSFVTTFTYFLST